MKTKSVGRPRGRPPRAKTTEVTVPSTELWTQLDQSTAVLEINGGGCVIRTAAGVCFLPDVILEDGQLMLLEFGAQDEEQKDEDTPTLPASATQSGWPQELHNTDGTWYYRVLDGDEQQSATYVKMFSAPGNIVNYDREFFHIPLANQKYGDVKFEKTAFDTVPDWATFPK